MDYMIFSKYLQGTLMYGLFATHMQTFVVTKWTEEALHDITLSFLIQQFLGAKGNNRKCPFYHASQST